MTVAQLITRLQKLAPELHTLEIVVNDDGQDYVLDHIQIRQSQLLPQRRLVVALH